MKRITAWVIAGITLAAVVYDILPAVNQRPGDTISEVLYSAAKKRPIIAVAWGLLTGHLFWGQKDAG